MLRQEKLLFTPGPLTTSTTVREAMQFDLGSRDSEFIQLIADIRQALLEIAGVSVCHGFETVLLQGSGTFAVEATLSTVVGPNDRLLILINGAYGNRIAEIAECHGIQFEVYEVPSNQVHKQERVDSILCGSRFTHLAAVHCETTTGILNPIGQWGVTASMHGCEFIVDAMSSFGGIPLDAAKVPIDYTISSANKCLQGVPGLAFVIANRHKLMSKHHKPRTVSLDLRQQLIGLELNGQFRFTPPTHVLLALDQALNELAVEGGVSGRAARYHRNHEVLCCGMERLGFGEYVPRELQSDIITAFTYSDIPGFEFPRFYQFLSDRGMVIYPGKLAQVDCFRIGNIGNLYPKDLQLLLVTIEEALQVMQN
jgi:2-aminoethylphosphonate-pyruvate transaminase